MRRAAIGLMLWMAGLPVAAQTRPREHADFVRTVRAATQRYRDQAVATADGYRPIGPDFPSMGEHWLSVPLVVRGETHPLRPPILEYVTVNGRAVLAGVAYTQLVRDGRLESSLPAPPSAWHYHQGSVDEESFILTHARSAAEPGSGAGPRVAVLHAWLWIDNPAGLFATDNWALPWYRLGLPPPAPGGTPSAADLAAALAAGGEGYFLTLVQLRYRLEPDRANRVSALLGRHGRELRSMLQGAVAAGTALSGTELALRWSAVQTDLRTVCPECRLWKKRDHQP